MLIRFLVPYRVASHLLEPPHNVSAWLLEIVILMIVETEQQTESAQWSKRWGKLCKAAAV